MGPIGSRLQLCTDVLPVGRAKSKLSARNAPGQGWEWG